jgi:hypothetical protein
VYGKSAPGDRSVVAHVSSRLLELPIFDPGVHYGSVYLWYDTAAHAQRPSGYSTTAPKVAKATARRLERLNCGDWSGNTVGELRRLGAQTIALHLGLFLRNAAVPNRSYFAWRGLIHHDWKFVRRTGPVWVFARGGGPPRPSLTAPPTQTPVFCQGWYGDVGDGRFMSEPHAPLWIYGSGRVKLVFAPSPLPRRFTVDERPQRGPTLNLGKRGWHVVTVDVPHLMTGPNRRQVGARLVSIVRP